MTGGTEERADLKPASVDFTERLVDQFFRRWIWYVVPVVLLAFVGVRAAGNVQAEYVARGTLSASENPFVGSPEVRGTTIGAFESPASGISRLINEQLRSDSFVESVAAGAGLDDALASGFITTDVIRATVSAGPQGENLLTVQASWGDPQTAYLLVDATIESYLELLAETVAVDSIEAVEFWGDVRATAQERADAADLDLRTYTAQLGLSEGEELSAVQDLDVGRLSAKLDNALADVRAAQEQIDSAELSVAQTTSEAGRQVRVVDPPQTPLAPTQETLQKLTTVAMFTIIGISISAVALVIATAIDHSVRTTGQLRAATGLSSAVTLPRTKSLRNWTQPNRNAA